MARSAYNVILKDLTKDHEYYWTKKIRADIKDYLTSWFTEVLKRSPRHRSMRADVWWSSNELLVDPDELVVYFVPSQKHSLVSEVGKGDTSKESGAGATMATQQGVISEVFIAAFAGDGRLTKKLAVMAFHELMHNKLDAYPQKKAVANVHATGGAGASNPGHTTPTTGNYAKMGQFLHLEIPQYTGHLFSKAVGSVQQSSFATNFRFSRAFVS